MRIRASARHLDVRLCLVPLLTAGSAVAAARLIPPSELGQFSICCLLLFQGLGQELLGFGEPEEVEGSAWTSSLSAPRRPLKRSTDSLCRESRAIGFYTSPCNRAQDQIRERFSSLAGTRAGHQRSGIE
jgi:hypothetical protein